MSKAATYIVFWIGVLLNLGAETCLDAIAAVGSGISEVAQAEEDFRRRDVNRDAQLSLEELLANQPKAELPRLRQQWIVLDFDGNRHLNLDEFRCAPGRVPRDLRGLVPDPIGALRDGALKKWLVLFETADGDRDDSLARQEWPAEKIAATAAALGEVDFETWDRDGDGDVTRAEGRWMFDLAYGFIRPDGRPLRMPNGIVLDWSYLRGLDTNHDGLYSREEFIPRFHLSKEENANVFAHDDSNGDGVLSLAELEPRFWFDVLGNFLVFDSDLDGYLSHDELMKNQPSSRVGGVGRRTITAFDADGDGKLSFAEYRATTFTNVASNWHQRRFDADDDGRLSLSEYDLETPPFCLGLAHHIFEHFDLDADGLLNPDEFDFRVRSANTFYILNADGTAWAKLFESASYPKCGSPTVSPDGLTLAFDAWRVSGNGKQGRPTVFFANIDGSDCRQICQGQMPSWSPNGKLFACSRTEGGPGIAIMTRDGQTQQVINNGWSAQWSPDGKTIAYYQERQLMVYDRQTNESRDVLGKANMYQQIFWNMCWSPDSKQICFKAARRDGKFDLVLVNAAGAVHGLKVRYSGDSFNPKFAWHPRESRVVFSMSCADRGVLQLYEFDPKTDDPPTLVRGQDPQSDNGDPCWTPDGERLIVTCGGY